MKKKILIMLLLVVALVIALAGCENDGDVHAGEPNMLYDPNAEGMQIIEGANSYDLMKKAYESYVKSEQYAMTIDFVFKAQFLGQDLYQSTYQKTIRNNGDFYDYYIQAGKGIGVPKNAGREFKYDATTKKSQAKYLASNKISLDENKKAVADFSGAQWGQFDSSQEDGIKTVKDKINKTKQSFHQYNWLEDKYLSTQTDKRVFEKDNKFYCTILINTVGSSVKTNQPEVIKAIETATKGQFSKFNENTRMIAEIEKVGESYRFTQFILMEDYSGINSSIGKNEVNASQYYWHKFSYDEASLVIPQ